MGGALSLKAQCCLAVAMFLDIKKKKISIDAFIMAIKIKTKLRPHRNKTYSKNIKYFTRRSWSR